MLSNIPSHSAFLGQREPSSVWGHNGDNITNNINKNLSPDLENIEKMHVAQPLQEFQETITFGNVTPLLSLLEGKCYRSMRF